MVDGSHQRRSPERTAEADPDGRWAAEPATDGPLALVSSPRPIRVVIVDERTLVGGDLHVLLGEQPDIEVISSARDLDAVAAEVRNRRPDVVVLDLAAGDHCAVAVLRGLLAQLPRARIVVLAAEHDVASAPLLLAAGALAFVARESIERAVRAAGRGERFISARIERGLKSAPRPHGDDRLTARETEVLGLIALGHTSVETAAALRLSPRTVETHRARIYKKLELATRADLVGYALRRGLLRA